MTEVVIGDVSNDSDNDDSGSGSTDDDGDDSADDSGDSGNDNGGDDNNNDSDEENPDDSDDPSENIDYELDTDSDSLPDYYEEILGTDKNKSDTDGDGLNDGWEVLYLGTDPLKADSDDNGVSDSEEDPDADGLSNLKECEIGTDPNTADTDSDGLNDGDEANTHGTDPLKYDSDDDGISDGDEITLGLNPSSASTDGTPDSEKTFTQTVSADSDVLSAVNEDEKTPFDVSLEINAAGVAENNIYARESGYSNAIENSAIIGMAPEFVYTDGLAVEEVTVKFELDESIVNNTLGTYAETNSGFEDINRFTVFMFFEDVNMLLPVETNYDETNNIVSATTDRVGTYCLMDMELFFDNLGIEPTEENSVEKLELASSLNSSTYTAVKNDLSSTNTVKKSFRDNFDVAFLIDSRMGNNEPIAEIKESILKVCEDVFFLSPNARIRFVQLLPVERSDVGFYQSLTDGDGNEFCTNYSDVVEVLDKIKPIEIENENNASGRMYNTCNVRPGLMEVLASEPMGKYAYCFYVVKKEQSLYNEKEVDWEAGENIEPTISVSVISDYIPSVSENENDETEDDKKYAYIPQLCENTNGFIASYDEIYESCMNEIYGDIPDLDSSYKVIIATRYSTVVLDKPLTEKCIENGIKYRQYYGSDGEIEFDEEDIEDCADTDGDGLYDFQEIKIFRGATSEPKNQIIKFENGELKLPTVDDMFDEVLLDIYPFEKVEEIKESFRDRYGDYSTEFWNNYVLPIYSDPTEKDTDTDTVEDGIDKQPLKPYLMISSCIYGDYSHDVDKHSLFPAIINGEYLYECINCGECFIPPEKEDINVLSLHEYVLVTALENIYVKMFDIDIKYAEGIYRIIDNIRSNYSYDYHSEGNTYTSPIKYVYKQKEDYDFRINITFNQVTHTDLLKSIIAQYEAELLLCGFAVFDSKVQVGSIADIVINFVNDLNKKGNLTFDNVKDTLANMAYTFIDSLDEKKLIKDLLDFKNTIGVGNTVLSIGYLNKINSLAEGVNSGKISKYNFYVSVDILDENNGNFILTSTNGFNNLSESLWADIQIYHSKETLVNLDLTNTYVINNHTEGNIIRENQRCSII